MHNLPQKFRPVRESDYMDNGQELPCYTDSFIVQDIEDSQGDIANLDYAELDDTNNAGFHQNQKFSEDDGTERNTQRNLGRRILPLSQRLRPSSAAQKSSRQKITIFQHFEPSKVIPQHQNISNLRTERVFSPFLEKEKEKEKGEGKEKLQAQELEKIDSASIENQKSYENYYLINLFLSFPISFQYNSKTEEILFATRFRCIKLIFFF